VVQHYKIHVGRGCNYIDYGNEGYSMLLTKECDYGIRVIRALADGTKKTVEAI